jgi:outer membrane beta-barrel protein
VGYHLSEDFFVQGSYGRSSVSDEAFRQVLPGGVFPNQKETLSYANLSLGWNLLPGEVFVGRGIAKASAFYLVGGVGTTHVLQPAAADAEPGLWRPRADERPLGRVGGRARPHLLAGPAGQAAEHAEPRGHARPVGVLLMERRTMPRALAASLMALFPLLGRAGVQADGSAPDFTLRTLGGAPVRLGELRGKVVLVNFWASWCGPCRQELPQLNRLHDTYRSAGLALLGVNVDDDPQKAADVAQRQGLRFPVLLDSNKAVVRRYDLGSMPATVLIDRDGQVRFLHRGWHDGLDATYERQIRELIKE